MLTTTAEPDDMPPAPPQEHVAAFEWRRAMKLSRRELAELTGYSEKAIQNFEDGKRPDGAPISGESMRAYKMACAYVTAGLVFDWKTAKIDRGGVQVAVTPDAVTVRARLL